MSDLNRLKGFSRRHLIKLAGAGALATGIGFKLADPATAKSPAPAANALNSDQALKLLADGNKRYVAKKLTHPNQTSVRLQEVAKAQHPFAIVLGCSDSRVPPELVFDQGLGDLFIIRVAGNIVDDAVLGSIEYAAEHLDVPLVMVLGHERCGAVKATVDGGAVPGHISTLIKAIQPAVDSVKGKPGDALDNAVRANIKLVVGQLKTSTPIIVELLKHGKLKIVGARYDLDSGVVDIIA
jgi:carbonic anhydrase